MKILCNCSYRFLLPPQFSLLLSTNLPCTACCDTPAMARDSHRVSRWHRGCGWRDASCRRMHRACQLRHTRTAESTAMARWHKLLSWAIIVVEICHRNWTKIKMEKMRGDSKWRNFVDFLDFHAFSVAFLIPQQHLQPDSSSSSPNSNLACPSWLCGC